jgi:hypothetical protein
MDNDALQMQYQKTFSNYSWIVESSSFTFNSFRLGAQHIFPSAYSSRLSANIKAMIGFGSVTTPKIMVEGHNQDSTLWVYNNSRSVSFLGGVGLHYALNRYLAISCDMDYQYSSFKVLYPVQNSNFGNGAVKPGKDQIPTYRFPGIQTINVLLGISFIL